MESVVDKVIFSIIYVSFIIVFLIIILCVVDGIRSAIDYWDKIQDCKKKLEEPMIDFRSFNEEDLKKDTPAGQIDSKCLICYCNKANVANVSCGHVSMCINCACKHRNDDKCIICRSAIKTRLILFY